MSFLKIKDPKRRDLIVEEFLKTKKNIQDSFITERLEDISAQRELSKFFQTGYGYSEGYKRKLSERD